MAAPTITSTVPVSGAVGVPVNSTIKVTFDQEIDTYRLANGGIILEGPDESKVLGPEAIDSDPPLTDEDEFLSSPGFKGIKDVDITFNRVDGDGNIVPYYDYGDSGAVGSLYNTQVVLTPKNPMAALTEYTVTVIGDVDTSDSYSFGLTNRSVFDPRKGANSGNGNVVFYGGFLGAAREQFTVEITTAGIAGTAEYEWWSDRDPVHRSNTSSLSYRLLRDGLKIRFVDGLNFEVGDTFSVWCDVPEYMEGMYDFSFTTSDQSPETLPVPSSLITGISDSGSTSTSTGTFSVSETDPEDRAYFVDPDLLAITVTFSAAVDASTVTDSTVTLKGYAVDEDPSGTFTETLTKTLSVSGTVLTISLTTSEIYENNSVVITLDSTIADEDGTTLNGDYKFFYSTQLTPFYCGVRAVKLRLGSIGEAVPDETIALAILDASRYVAALATIPSSYTDVTVYNEARRQFTVCYAAWLIATSYSGSGSGSSQRKRLSDFDVSNGGDPSGSAGLDDDLKDCWMYWMEMIKNGGNITGLYKPVNVVKGDNDVDQPNFGRMWEVPCVPISNNRALYSGSRRWVHTNFRRN